MTPADRRSLAARRIVAHVAERLQADLSVRLWTGEVLPLGPGARDDIQIVLTTPGAVRRLLLRPGLMTVFELFASGGLRIEGGGPLDVGDRWDHGRIVHLARNIDRGWIARQALPFLFMSQREAAAPPAWNGDDGVGRDRTGRRDADFIRFHYDVGNDFYGLFLDREMVYSSAVFPDAEASLDDAQQHKLALICRKLNLKPGQKLLDIGCGWGALACHAAREHGVQVHGVTLSPAQLEYGREKAARLGLSDRVTLELKDYREIDAPGAYDAVSQVEMFEHLGFAEHDRHFQAVHRLLKPGGLHFHQATVRRGGADRVRPTATTRVITRFIFPGGELDTLAMTTAALGRNGFEVMDVENLREHFELTLRHWSRRLHDRRAEAAALVGDARVQLWALYFAVFAKGFERGAALNYQVVARRRRAGASGLPLDRRGAGV